MSKTYDDLDVCGRCGPIPDGCVHFPHSVPGGDTSTKVGALIYRRANGFWCIDEFDWQGRYRGSHGGNHSAPYLVGWKQELEWPQEPTPLGALSAEPFHRREEGAPRVRVGLVRVIDEAAA